ncbi:hypothetical protein J5X98_19795 [Leptothermofonsia sichuanensis E412]|uniref:hypothetical protein n=1 Tax=Leptothermofonsia sichuanensis TaxID=2917832 RepID=UPI001CA6E137|nr:hypothetical protein [Leptothermofonsia sichuanensis]QZZ19568.1 hypothetical protein J5X98_19795 [Leptothermofonsia sichuanensis E412]
MVESNSDSQPSSSLAKLWGKRYVQSLLSYSQSLSDRDRNQFAEISSLEGRAQTASKLLKSLNFASAQAWSKTESLLTQEVQRHQINPQHIDPWLIARESHQLFEMVLAVYQQGKPPQSLATVISAECGRVRRMVSAQDPRVIGFTSMQIHYTGQMLLEPLSDTEKILMVDYFKVLDDHLYMPLQRAYEAAANQDEGSFELEAVQSLLPQSGKIAQSICTQVAQEFSTYRSYSGVLPDPQVLISSIRDVEMFQIYLCVCALENAIAAFQEELFPLCVMLYPPLKVEWRLVRLLVQLLEQAINKRVSPLLSTYFHPYLQAMQDLFTTEVVGL